MSHLRRLLGSERLRTQASGYVLRVGPGELDLERFKRLRGERRLREALSLWRGRPLAGLHAQRLAQTEIPRLEELRLTCLEERIARDMERGDDAELVGELEALVAEHPLRESLWDRLMLCLYRSGRQAEALDTYRAARARLVEELGIEPTRRLHELHGAILRQDPGLDLVAADPPAAVAPRGAFVGREAVLAELAQGLDEVLAGRGRLFLLTGEPGIGKTRLAEELLARARERGARVLTGRCWEAGGAPAYWPWVQSLRGHIRDTDTAELKAQLGSGATALAQIVPELREQLPDLPAPPALEPDQARFALFDATVEFLRSASRERPIVLFLDDLHAADEPSVLLLRFLAREVAATRILALAAYRDIDPLPGPTLTTLLAAVVQEPAVRRIRLEGLSGSEIARYAELVAPDVASTELATGLHADTEGNPFFAGEILRLRSVEGRPVALPQSVRDVIARRISHLSEECNRMLVLAAILGREFDVDALVLVGDMPEDVVVDLLEEAMVARVVSDVPRSPGRLRFAHALIRDTLYVGLTAIRRTRLHGLALEALKDHHGEDSSLHLAELAHHAVAGGSPEAGLRYAWRAGDRALEVLAYEEAVRLYGLALEALAIDEPTRCELLLSLGDARARAGLASAAQASFLEAADIAQRRGLRTELARAAVGYAGRTVWARAGSDARLVPLLESGLAALGDDAIELRARLLARLSGALRDEHDRTRRDALSAEAVDHARRSADPAALAFALDGRAAAITAPDRIEECLALTTELIDVAAGIADRERELQARLTRMIVLVQLGDMANAQLDLAAASATALGLRQPTLNWQVVGVQAMLALAVGAFTEAEALTEQVLDLGGGAPQDAVTSIYLLQRYTLREARGGLADLLPQLRDLVASAPARPVFGCVLAHLLAQSGEHAEAADRLSALADDDVAALPFDQEWLFGMSFLAETCSLLGDAEAAAVLYRRLLPWASLNVADQSEGMRGALSRYLGLLATTTERWEDAEHHFAAAIAMNARIGLRPWVADTRRDLARMHLARARTGDRASAAELLRAAGATYRELGMYRDASLPD